MCDGENKKNPKKNPTHVEQHIIHDRIPEMKLKIPEKIGTSESPIFFMVSLIPLKILP